jgi:soluble lytic murein transglycosylase-like protein
MKRIRIVWTGLLLLGLFLPAMARLGAQGTGFKPYDLIVRKIAEKHGIEADLIHAIIRAESNYDSFALSEKGAMGLMQLMPDTAKTYGVNNYFDPEENIEGGTKFLKDLIKLYGGKRDLVLAAYNAGQEAVKKYKGIPPYPETRTYIRRIQASYKFESIRTRTEIYKYYDQSGCLVLTNDRRLYNLNKTN